MGARRVYEAQFQMQESIFLIRVEGYLYFVDFYFLFTIMKVY